jgi:hypothetical protein
MTDSEHGLRVLHTAIVSGRAGQRPDRVDKNGAPLRTGSDASVGVDDPWLRRTFPAGAVVLDIEGEKETPGSKFERARRKVGELVDSLESALREAETVEGPTGPYVRDFGWPTEDAEALGNRLTKLSARLAVWGQMYAVVGDPGDSEAGEPRQQEDR